MSHRKAKLRELFEEQSGKCAYCQTNMTLTLGRPNTATKEHVIPKSKFKISDTFNLVAACSTCNSLKSDMPLSKFIGLLVKRNNLV